MVAIEDAPATVSYNRMELEKQREAKRAKEEMLHQMGIEKAKESLVEAAYYHRMYNSLACWKGDKRVVTRNLKKMTSEASKYEALKENIKIRVVGFNWTQFAITWSKKGRKRPIKELADRLRVIVAAEKNMTIPKEPEIQLPQRPEMAVLGTMTKQREDCDEADEIDEDAFRKDVEKLRHDREARGEGSMHQVMQPFYRPDLEDLLNERIDVLYEFVVDDGSQKAMRWCQGEVIKVYSDKSDPTVLVRWDAMPDVEGGDKITESNQILRPSKWNKNVKGAWRMDVEIEIEPVGDDDDDLDSDSDTDTGEAEGNGGDSSEDESKESSDESNDDSDVESDEDSD